LLGSSCLCLLIIWEGVVCPKLPFLINFRSMILKICEACEQFKKRVTEWNYWSGAIETLPYIDDMIKPHKHLIFKGRRSDGAAYPLLRS